MGCPWATGTYFPAAVNGRRGGTAGEVALDGLIIAQRGQFPGPLGVVLPWLGGQQKDIGGPWGSGRSDGAALGRWLTARRHLWHFSYLPPNTEITLFSPTTAETAERLIVSQVIFSTQIELNGSWKQLHIKLQQIYVLFKPTQAHINASVAW